MGNRKLFDSMSLESKRFYSRVFNTAVLNLHAVRHGMFDIILCETDDPKVSRRWQETLPKIIDEMVRRKQRDEFGE